MARVFQYGSNLSTARLNHADRLRGDAHTLGIAITRDDYEFAFDIWSKADGGRAVTDIVPGTGRKIWGVIYEIPDQLIRRETAKPRKSLDAIEGEGDNYRRVPINLQWPDGRPVIEPVITYIGNARKPGIQTNWDYVQHILIGLDEHRIPKEYCNYVIERILTNNSGLREEFEKRGGWPWK